MSQTEKAPTDVGEERSWFDNLADRMSDAVARAPFFVVSLASIVAWVALGPSMKFSLEWEFILHTPAIIVTFVLVALLENEQRRSDQSTQRKLNAIASALADFMHVAEVDEAHVDQLKAAVGLEKRESATE